jgi:hypothetical protein
MLARPLGQPLVASDLPDPLWIAAGLGIVGGVFVGKIIYTQVFVEGLTSDERKNMLLFATASAAMWGVQQLFDLSKIVTDLGNQVGIPNAGDVFK